MRPLAGDPSQVEAMAAIVTDPQSIKEFFGDPVWSEEFWEHPLVECACRQPSTSGGSAIDVDRFLSMNPPHLARLNPGDLNRDVPKGYIICPSCNRAQEVALAAPRYLWAPLAPRRHAYSTEYRIAPYAYLRAALSASRDIESALNDWG